MFMAATSIAAVMEPSLLCYVVGWRRFAHARIPSSVALRQDPNNYLLKSLIVRVAKSCSSRPRACAWHEGSVVVLWRVIHGDDDSTKCDAAGHISSPSWIHLHGCSDVLLESWIGVVDCRTLEACELPPLEALLSQFVRASPSNAFDNSRQPVGNACRVYQSLAVIVIAVADSDCGP